MSESRGATLALLLLAALAAASCSSPGDIAEQSMRANLGVEQAANAMLVLNALRAADRRPMHFTAVTGMTLPVPQASASVDLSVPLTGSGGSAGLSAHPEIPFFNVAVLDSQKFITGITTPLKPSLAHYYFDQGWPPMLLFSLMVREIDYPDVRFINDPGSRQRFEAFQSELRGMLACGLKLNEVDLVSGLEPPAFKLPEGGGLMSSLAGVAREGFVVVPQKDASGKPTGRWLLARPRSDVLLDFAALQSPACRALPQALRERFLRSNESNIASKGAVMDYPGPAGSRRAIGMMLRSPESILYYLGELVRAEEIGDDSGVRYTPLTTIDLARGRRAPIFKVSRGKRPGTFVSVDYDGTTYSVASGADDRSSQSLSLLSLLIGLQKEASEIPNTAPIRLIGP